MTYNLEFMEYLILGLIGRSSARRVAQRLAHSHGALRVREERRGDLLTSLLGQLKEGRASRSSTSSGCGLEEWLTALEWLPWLKWQHRATPCRGCGTLERAEMVWRWPRAAARREGGT